MKEKLSRLAADGGALLFGSALCAFGFSCFTIPNNIAPGGVSGLATAIAHVTGVSVAVLSLLFNIPLLLLAWRGFGLRPLLRTLAGTVMFSVMLELLTLTGFAYANNRLLASVLGGACIGGGLGIMFLRSYNTGGTDLVAMMLQRKLEHWPPGQLLMVLDVAVVVIAVLVFGDIEVALYSVVTIFVTSKVMDGILRGVDYATLLFVISEREEALSAALMEGSGRGVTILHGRGAYTGAPKGVLMIAVRRREVPNVLRLIRHADPKAFTILTSANEVRGEGFKEE